MEKKRGAKPGTGQGLIWDRLLGVGKSFVNQWAASQAGYVAIGLMISMLVLSFVSDLLHLV